jgi:uncharacterized delta-60 repeat protein
VPSTAGYLDPSFGAPEGYVVSNPNSSGGGSNAVVVQPDGKIVVAGSAADAKGNSSLAVLRYNVDGTPDATFGSGGLVLTKVGNYRENSQTAEGLALQADGKIVVCGSVLVAHSGLNYDFEWVLARYDANGTLDTTFGGGRRPTGIVEVNLGTSRDEAYDVQVQPWDGKIVVAGTTVRSATGNDVAIGRFNANGTLDSTFGTGGIFTSTISGAQLADHATDLALQPDHKIVAVGDAGDPATGYPHFLVLRLNDNGSLDPSFNGTGIVSAAPAVDPNCAGSAVALQPDGSIVVAGNLGTGAAYEAAFARFTSAGALDPTFGSGGWAFNDRLSFAGDIVIHPGTGGAFDVVGGLIVRSSTGTTYSNAITRLSYDGSVDTSFGANAGVSYLGSNVGTSTSFTGLALQSDGNIVVTGTIYLSSTTPRAIVVARYFGATTTGALLAAGSGGNFAAQAWDQAIAIVLARQDSSRHQPW